MIYQSQRIKRTHSLVLPLLVGFFVVSIVGISVWFLRQQTRIAPQASPSTALAFSSPSQSVAGGKSITSDIMVDPGKNQVSAVKLALIYDSSLLTIAEDSIVVNQQAFPQTLDTPVITCANTTCTLSATFSVGSDATKVIQTKTAVARLTIKATEGTSASTTVTFDSTTAVYSVLTQDSPSGSVLATTTPFTVNITGGDNVCKPNESTCSWDTVAAATGYHYKVTETGSGKIMQEGDVTASQTSVTFASEQGKTYKCEVTSSSACGKSYPGIGTSTCPVVTPTPTRNPSLTPTPTICEGPGKVKNLHIICPDRQ